MDDHYQQLIDHLREQERLETLVWGLIILGEIAVACAFTWAFWKKLKRDRGE